MKNTCRLVNIIYLWAGMKDKILPIFCEEVTSVKIYTSARNSLLKTSRTNSQIDLMQNTRRRCSFSKLYQTSTLLWLARRSNCHIMQAQHKLFHKICSSNCELKIISQKQTSFQMFHEKCSTEVKCTRTNGAVNSVSMP